VSRRLFDLNVEDVLDNWEVRHAVREVIANALDEQVITKTRDIQIVEDRRGAWHIRDFGRGLQIDHFTLNENEEKLSYASGIIGKFGVGLKDALATFHRRGVDVLIRSRHGTYRLLKAQKHNFDGIVTLHVEYDDAPTDVSGTEFVLQGVSDSEMSLAKALFLRFSDENLLETTRYGQILRRKADGARVYINGVLASEELNFLFSYNVTNLTESMRKRLNRERLNVGRSTYTDRIKSILKQAQASEVQDLLIDQIHKRSAGEQCDEMQWIEISQMALNLLSQRQSVALVTERELQERPDVIDLIRRDAHRVVIIDERQKTKLDSQMGTGGPVVRTFEVYTKEYHQSFQYRFVHRNQLTSKERKALNLAPKLMGLVGVSRRRRPTIRISETMRVTTDDTGGVWDPDQQAIIIKRSLLSSPTEFAGTLLHEVAHADTGTRDATRDFERVLTRYLGTSSVAATR